MTCRRPDLSLVKPRSSLFLTIIMSRMRDDHANHDKEIYISISKENKSNLLAIFKSWIRPHRFVKTDVDQAKVTRKITNINLLLISILMSLVSMTLVNMTFLKLILSLSSPEHSSLPSF